MSTDTRTTLVCDVPDDDYGEHPARWTVRVGMDDKEWEADLCDGHAAAAEQAFAPFIRAARPTRPRQPKRPVAGRRRAAAIRSWARSQGLDVSDRGRISAGILARYKAAQGR